MRERTTGNAEIETTSANLHPCVWGLNDRRNGKVGRRVADRIVDARSQRALADGVGAHVLAGGAGQTARESVASDQ